MFQRRYYYIIEHKPGRYADNSIIPAIEGYIYRCFEAGDIDETDPLVMYVYNTVADAKQRLDSGAVVFCIFKEKELASIGWVAMNRAAKDSLFQPPFTINFDKGEAATGGGWTNPTFRGKGLAALIYCKRLEYCRDRGINTIYAAVRVNNRISLKMHARFNPLIRGKGRELGILWFRSWKEVPVNLEISKVTK